MEAVKNSAEQFREAQSRARIKQKAPSGRMAAIPSWARAAMLGGMMSQGLNEEPTMPSPLGMSAAMEAEQDLSTTERFHAEQNRTAISQQSLGLNPAVERLAANNNISAEVYQQATAKPRTLTQQMRGATTMAQLQGLNQQYLAMNQELTESGLNEEQLKVLDDGRRWVWRGIVDGLPLIDDFLLGADFGIGTTVAGGVDAYQWVSGMGNFESHIESNLKFFAPPPKQISTPEKAGIFRTVMHWGVDVLGSFLLWFVQIGWMIALGITFFIIILVGSYCAYNTVFSLTNPVCLDLASGVINVIKAAIISN